MKMLLFFLNSFSTVLEVVTIKYLWLWFVVPLGFVEISFVHTLGISILIFLFTHRFLNEDFESKSLEERLGLTIMILLKTATCLFVGWLASNFM